MFGVKRLSPSPLPAEGPVLLVCDHTSLGDPLVLLASAGRPISFLMAREIYVSCFQWAYEAFDAIPVRRGAQDIQAVRGMLQRLRRNGVVGLFPEGGLDRHRDEGGRPGIGYLALKTGAPIVPASVVWARERSVTSIIKTLCIPCKAVVHYGDPLVFAKADKPDRTRIDEVTTRVMTAIEDIRKEISVNR
ncbi:MAG: 1-acyl-sn-glycerol-3-phosphate acyltransferase [Nitrospira sp.]|nr:1-acyl-sn-glycerol-3-phosphate acyltransferase [Nitrospira sp.]